ncbi:MAG: hypothetical protein WDW38_006614 [Sanguina aurantia]
MTQFGEIYDVEVRELDEQNLMAAHPCPSRSPGVSLLPHQRRALQRCREMEESELRDDEDAMGSTMRTSIGVYGDAAGTGKSHVMLALLMGDQSNDLDREASGGGREAAVHGPSTRLRTFADGRIRINEVDMLRHIKTTIIVIPHTLTSQWEGYLRPMQDAKLLNTLVISRRKSLDSVSRVSLEKLDLIVVTNSFYDDLARLLSMHRVRIRRLIVDEADTIVINSYMTVASKFTWFVTASYGNLMFPMGNARYEPLLMHNICIAKGLAQSGFIRMLFMSLHSTLSRSHFRRLVVKNSRHSIHCSIQSVCRGVVHEMVPSLTPHSIRVLAGIVDRMVIECLNAGDIASAVGQIAPEKKHTEQDVVMLMAESYTNKLLIVRRRLQCLGERLTMVTDHDPNTDTDTDTDTGANTDTEEEAETLREVQRVTKIADDLEHKIECMRVRLLEDDVCCICLDTAVVQAIVPCCTTKMCLECITRWVVTKSSCVLCRRPLAFSDLHVIQPASDLAGPPEPEPLFDATRTCGVHNTKMQNLEVILKHHIRGSTLIFSNYEKSFDEICRCLTGMGKTFDFLRGGNRQISNTVESYKDGRVDVLLVNASHYGGG